MWQNFNDQQRRDLMAAMSGPKVMHAIRLANRTKEPLTTAPAIIVQQGRILAQGMMTYTPAGASGDLEITTAVDIAVKKRAPRTKQAPPILCYNRVITLPMLPILLARTFQK